MEYARDGVHLCLNRIDNVVDECCRNGHGFSRRPEPKKYSLNAVIGLRMPYLK